MMPTDSPPREGASPREYIEVRGSVFLSRARHRDQGFGFLLL
ncbi:hypothetical protein HMPREF9573_01354 [Cutibacterium acnes HL072PA2]|nr:hypothetical protein HMPREF9573_01354 [Cutibacterium acnes HL072PA2]